MEIPHTKKTTFTSWDKTVSITTIHQKPDRVRTLKENISEIQIPRGSGLSLAPVSFGHDIIVREVSSFNRILEFNATEKTVVVESGITLGKLLEWSFKEKLFFPVLPGSPQITVGGCIAGNVHGKNPSKDGSFKEHVIEIELFHPKFGSRIIESGSDLFEATCGGLGLTGIITKAKIQLYDLPSDRIVMSAKKVDSLTDAIKIFEENSNADILYSWHIGSVFKNFGKGVLQIGSFSSGFHDKNLIIPKPSDTKKIQLPFSFWGKITAGLILYIFRKLELRRGKTERNIFNAFFPFTGPAKWIHALYGKKGFREYQILVSKNNINNFINDLTELVMKEKPNLIFIGLRPFRGNQKFLQFSGDGISIALNFKNSSSDIQFLNKIDELAISHHAIPNIIKDSRLSKNVVEKCYPQYDKFKNILKDIDTDRIFRSYVSQQLDL